MTNLVILPKLLSFTFVTFSSFYFLYSKCIVRPRPLQHFNFIVVYCVIPRYVNSHYVNSRAGSPERAAPSNSTDDGFIWCHSYSEVNCTIALERLNISEIPDEADKPPECKIQIIKCERLCEAQAYLVGPNGTELEVSFLVTRTKFVFVRNNFDRLNFFRTKKRIKILYRKLYRNKLSIKLCGFLCV